MPEEAAFGTMLGDMMAQLTVAKFTPEQVRELLTGDVYQDTVDELGFNPLDPGEEQCVGHNANER